MAVPDLAITICLLTSLTRETRDALQLPQNHRRLLPTASSEEGPLSPRENTPVLDLTAATIQLTLADSDKPYDPVRGFTFGSDNGNEEISVLLHPIRGGGAISRLHFSINFNFDTKALVVTNHSRYGTVVTSRAHGKVFLENLNTTTLLDGDTIQAGVSCLSVEIPSRGEYQKAYDRSWNAYRNECLAATPQIGLLGLADDIITKEDGGMLGLMEVLGTGVGGIVYKAIDHRGFFYAVKAFHAPANSVMAASIEREIDTLTSLSHKYIITSFDKVSVRHDGPTLAMEYIQLGTLATYRNLTPITAVCIFRQMLEGLVYLHELGLAHRDLKPANILVKSDNPFHILLSDFGFAGKDPLRTFCGTQRYCAPEVHSAKSKKLPYSNMVDIWSVGVMILEYTVASSAIREPSPWVPQQWLESIEDARRQRPHTGWERLMNLANLMLIQNPYHRPTAVTCLSAVNDSSLRDPVRAQTLLSSEHNTLPAKMYKNIIGNRMSADILRTWMNREATKDPPIAINLTKIYGAIGQTRQVMRVDVKRAVHYTLRSKLESSDHKSPMGTYVSLETAILLLERRAPSEKDLLYSLSQLRQRYTTTESVGENLSRGTRIGYARLPKASQRSLDHASELDPLHIRDLPSLNPLPSDFDLDGLDYLDGFEVPEGGSAFDIPQLVDKFS